MTWEDLHSSESMEWETPQALFDHFDRRFKFDLDAAAAAHNYKVKNHFSKERCAFKHRWADHGSAVWLNPPYGRRVGLWIAEAQRQAIEGKIKVVVLIMARTDTAYFHDLCMKANEIHFIRGRVKFERDDGHTGPAPCGSMAVLFDGKWQLNKPNFYGLELDRGKNEKTKKEAASLGMGY